MTKRPKITALAITLAATLGILSLSPSGGVVAAPIVRQNTATDIKTVIRGLTVYEWDSGKAAIEILANKPASCLESGTRSCYAYLKNSAGGWIGSKAIYGSSASLYAAFERGLDSAFESGPLQLVFGTEEFTYKRLLESNVIAPPEDSQFIEVARADITKADLNRFECNPLSDLIAKTEDINLKHDLMDSLIWNGQFGENDIIDAASVGIELEGVTQRTKVKNISFGQPAQDGFITDEFPSKGLYRTSAVSDDSWAPVALDCTSTVSAQVLEYLPFRIGVDGVVMYFHVLDDYAASNVWVTISGRTYQVLKNGRDVVPSGGLFKKCDSIVKDFSMGGVTCFVPKKTGTYTLSVTQQYQGSGNLLINCRSGYYGGIRCSTSRDNSATAKATGKFVIPKSGIVDGPDWWPF